jgi:hypothetical protein
MTYDVVVDSKSYRLDLTQVEGRWSCRLDGREIEVDAVLARPDVLSLRIGNNAYEVKCERVANDVHIWVGAVVSPLRCAIRDLCVAAAVRSTSTARED